MERSLFYHFFNKNKLFLIISSLIFILLFIVSLFNGRFIAADFEVYYYAAKSFLSGENMYAHAYGSSTVGFYKYTPFAALFYVPANLLPYQLASFLNYFLLSATSIFAIFLSSYIIVNKIYFQGKHVGNALLLITFFLSLTFLNREVMLGNINVLLLLFICLAVLNIDSTHPVISGLFYGMAIIFKPYLLIVILPLILHQKFKVLLHLFLIILVSVIVPFLFTGISGGIQLYKAWFFAVMNHNNYIISPFTFDSLLKNYLFTGAEINFTFYFIALVGAGYIAIKLIDDKRRSKLSNQNVPNRFFLLETFSLLALIPNLINTDTQQLLYSIPLVALLIRYLLRERDLLVLIPSIILFFFFSVDQPGLLGKSLSESFYRSGVAGISNIFIIGMAWLVFFKELNNQTTDNKIHN